MLTRSLNLRFLKNLQKEVLVQLRRIGDNFLPRNVTDSIIEISGIENLDDGSKICDPACGVGGFILEPMRTTSEGVKVLILIKVN